MSHRCRRHILPRALGAFVIFGSLVAGGCANTGDTRLTDSNRALTDRNQSLLQEVESLESANAELRSNLDRANATIRQQQDAIRQAQANADSVMNQMRGFEDRLTNLPLGSLDPVTDAALSELAARYPQYMVYDADAGRIRFTSDLTFKSGSDEVQAAAKESLNALAEILKAPQTQRYDIRVVGHTDSQPIKNAANRGHPTNMHLSAHRAIAVFNQLRQMGVSPQRIEVAGRGEFAPMVQNSSSGDTPQNRRVEVYLVPASDHAALTNVPDIAEPVTTPSRTRNNDDVMK